MNLPQRNSETLLRISTYNCVVGLIIVLDWLSCLIIKFNIAHHAHKRSYDLNKV